MFVEYWGKAKLGFSKDAIIKMRRVVKWCKTQHFVTKR